MLDVEHEYLAVADAPGSRGLLNCFDRRIEPFGGNHDLDFHFGQEIDDILRAPIELGVAFLPAEAFGLDNA